MRAAPWVPEAAAQAGSTDMALPQQPVLQLVLPPMLGRGVRGVQEGIRVLPEARVRNGR